MRVQINQIKGKRAAITLIDDLDINYINENLIDGKLYGYLDILEKDRTTEEQRKHYWAIVNDISHYTGHSTDDVNEMMKELYQDKKETDKVPSISRNKMSKKEVTEWLTLIILFCIDHQIPLNHPIGYDMVDSYRVLYARTINRECVVCGAYGAQIAHFVQTVGMGRDRNKINHTESMFLALCEKHHMEQHNIGELTFLDRYMLQPVSLSLDQLKELDVM